MDALPICDALRCFGELGVRAAARSFTGDLLLRETDGREHRVVLRRGTIVEVHVAGLFDPLLAELHRAGDLGDADYVRALEALASSQRRAGDLARDMGTPEKAIARALERQGTRRMRTLRERALDRGLEAFLLAREVPCREVRCRLAELPALMAPGRRRAPTASSCSHETPRPERGMAYRPIPSPKKTGPLGPLGPLDRRALRRLAFELHPDRHPHLSEEERAAMAAKLQIATRAFHEM